MYSRYRFGSTGDRSTWTDGSAPARAYNLPMIGRTFGRYRIVKCLGEGGMGTVWRAEDDLLGRSVALKLLSTRLTDSGSARARLLREARAAGAMEHPGIGTVYDAGEQDGEIFIAMRLVDGGTVSDRLASHGALGLLDAVRIAASAADALGHAHARGILHRDVSARNLMLTKDGQVVVVDFGLARAEGESRLTQSGTTVGTAYYMAPEIALGEKADRRSDIYSLGAVLYEMLTEAPPFEGNRLQAVLYAAVNTPAAAPSAKRPGIPPELDRIVLKTLAKKSDDRYGTMETLRDDLEALVASGTIVPDETAALPIVQPRRRSLSPRPTPDMTPTIELDGAVTGGLRSWTRARRLAAIGAAVVVLGLAGVGIARLLRRQPSPAATAYSSLAVLPFKNDSPRAEESNYLAEGLSQTLITKLTQLTTLRVPPWMTVRRFRDPSIPVEKLATDLKVDAILLGAYQSDGQRIRGTVSIVDGKSGFQVWADEFDEPLADLFTVQNKIAMGAATKLLGKLTGTQVDVLAAPAAASVEAYEFYLKGSLALQRQTQPDVLEADSLFRRALQIDPKFAPAWVGLGAALHDRYFFGWDGGLKELDGAEEAARKALELDSASIAARRVLINVFFERGKSEECLKQGKLVAASGDRSAEAILARAEAYLFGGLEDRSLPLLRQVMDEEPSNAAALWFMTVAGCWAGSFQDTLSAGEKFLSAVGEDPEVHLWMAVAFHSMGRRKEAEAHYRRAVETAPSGTMRYDALWAAAFYRQDGRLDDADRLALALIDLDEEKLLRHPDNYRVRGELGAAYGLVGDLARMRSEEDVIRRANGGSGLMLLGFGEGIVGEKQRFVEMRGDILRSGTIGHMYSNERAVYADPHLENYPGYKELAAEEAVEFKRLEALY